MFCKKCKQIIHWAPLILVLIIVLWQYYTFVIILCFQKINNYIQQIIYLIVYHMIFTMFLWTYYAAIATPVPMVPEKFKLPPREVDILNVGMEDRQNVMLEEFCRNLPVHNRTENGRIRYCKLCKQIKPDRAHHCSTCEKCILKMDHHCEWINNCVCFSNYKYFVLFIGYSVIHCLFIMATTYEFFVKCLQNSFKGLARFYIVALFLFAVVFGIALGSLFFYHIYLIRTNKTTIEALRPPVFINGPDKNGYNLGIKENFIQVFGNNLRKCFIPIYTSTGNGIEFPTHRFSNNSNPHELEV